MRVERLAQENNTMSPARTRSRTAQSGDEHTNHEASESSGPTISQLRVIMLFSSCSLRFNKTFIHCGRNVNPTTTDE